MVTYSHSDNDKEELKKKRLVYIKERYKKLILNPQKEVVSEIDEELKDDSSCSAVKA